MSDELSNTKKGDKNVFTTNAKKAQLKNNNLTKESLGQYFSLLEAIQRKILFYSATSHCSLWCACGKYRVK